ncbi:MAG: low molecular weight phosphotyrosine protein phosphatase [Bacteroidetes bacterium]|nr:low molecular weight phosphotyrosine protein phosphatase [Bacteroidota bacterium]
MSQPTRILFVCLGNICRSPLAEGLFLHHASQAGVQHLFEVDSAGTNGLHVGEDPDPRTRRNAAKHGIELNHKGRKFEKADFDNWDYILVMDKQNQHTVRTYTNDDLHLTKIHLLRNWDPISEAQEVPDPWYGGEEGFEQVFQILHRSTENLLRQLLKGHIL